MFGAGEGANYRFVGHGGEFHSTIGVVQLSYGMIGTLMFILLICISLKTHNFKWWFIIASILTYGLSHNGSRNSMFWILLVLMSYFYEVNDDIKT